MSFGEKTLAFEEDVPEAAIGFHDIRRQVHIVACLVCPHCPEFHFGPKEVVGNR